MREWAELGAVSESKRAARSLEQSRARRAAKFQARSRRRLTAIVTACTVAFLATVVVAFPPDATTADKQLPAIACWSFDKPTYSWKQCAQRQRANHVRAAKVIRELRQPKAKPATRSTSISYVVPYPWSAVAECESDSTWGYNGSSGFDGGLQFHPGTWSGYKLAGYPAFAYQASPYQQVQVAERVLADQGWGAWPACSRKLGLR